MSGLPEIPEPLRQRLHARVAECLQCLHEAGVRQAADAAPEIRLDLSGQSAGQAISSGVLRFNPHYLLHDSEHFLRQTVAHEVAHHVDFLRRGRSDHGPHWQRLMHALGLPAESRHRYDLPLSKVTRLRTFAYRCACRQLELTSIRHNRAQRSLAESQRPLYFCRQCREALVLVP